MSALARGLALLLLFRAAFALAEETAAAPSVPDTSNWSCRFCKFDSGTEGWAEATLGGVTSSSFHFGDYRGLDDRGVLLDAGGAWRYRDAERGERIDVRVDHAGLDARSVSVRTAKQGHYASAIEYDAIPHLVSREARTPFDTGNALPSGWARSGSTGGMSDLAASLHGVLLAPKRERLALGTSWLPRPATELHFDYHRDEVTGTGTTSGSFLTLATQLPKALHQKTDRFDASAAYQGSLGQDMQIGFASSFFHNDVTALGWQDPYAAFNGETRGLMAVAPDNSAHRLSLAASAPAGLPLQLTARASFGRMLQDDRFLPATTNPNAATPLPRGSLDGRVDTTLANLRAAYPLLRTLRISSDFLFDRRANKTESASWTQVVMDTFTGSARINVPYSFTRQRWRATVEQNAGARLAVGIEQDLRRRELAGTRDTRERTVWGRLGWRAPGGVTLRARYAHAERDAGVVTAAPDVPAQNSLLQPFQTAQRRRNELHGELGVSQGIVAATLNLGLVHNQYPGTVLGRTSDHSSGYGVELSAQPADALSLGLFAQRQALTSAQTGSENFSVPDWLADRSDSSSTTGIHVSWQAPRQVDVGLDYVLATSVGELALTTAAMDTAFPALVARAHDARLFVACPLRPNLSLRFDLEREIYTAQDWALDGVGPATIPNLLALGQGTRTGNVTAVLLSARYRF